MESGKENKWESGPGLGVLSALQRGRRCLPRVFFKKTFSLQLFGSCQDDVTGKYIRAWFGLFWLFWKCCNYERQGAGDGAGSLWFFILFFLYLFHPVIRIQTFPFTIFLLCHFLPLYHSLVFLFPTLYLAGITFYGCFFFLFLVSGIFKNKIKSFKTLPD